MSALDQLVESLLYEGYALYPYTPGAAKNATPTPFGIVYPPSYSETQPAAYPKLRMECILASDPDAVVQGTVRFLQASGDAYKAAEHRIDLERIALPDLIAAPVTQEFSYPVLAGEQPAEVGRLNGRVKLRAERIDEGLTCLFFCVHNSTEIPGEMIAGDEATRGEALRWSLVSTYPYIQVRGGRFVSPLEDEGDAGQAVQECDSFNTFPVLATKDDDAIMGAAIVLPEHPQIAPESLGNLFDNTEIEEALILHVQTLSDEERESITQQDPKVREMIAKADETTPSQLMDLHGRLLMHEPGEDALPGPPNNPGAPEVVFEGRTFRRGSHVRLMPQPGGDPHDVVLTGKSATIERIYTDYDQGIHLCVTVDMDPGQDLMRETGRYLFFRPDEVELLEGHGEVDVPLSSSNGAANGGNGADPSAGPAADASIYDEVPSFGEVPNGNGKDPA